MFNVMFVETEHVGLDLYDGMDLARLLRDHGDDECVGIRGGISIKVKASL